MQTYKGTIISAVTVILGGKKIKQLFDLQVNSSHFVVLVTLSLLSELKSLIY